MVTDDRSDAEVGTQTEFINAQEIARLTAAKPPRDPQNDPDHRMYVRMVLASLAVILVIAAGIGAVAMAHHRSQEQLATHRLQCEAALTDLHGRAGEYDQLVGGDALEAAKITDIQVADSRTVVALDEQLHAQTPESVTCSAVSIDGYDDLMAQISDNGEWYDAHIESLQSAVAQVQASKQEKDVKDAQGSLGDTIREARTELDLGRGKVLDASTYTTLEALIGQAETLAKGNDIEAMEAMAPKLTDAMAKVHASREAKVADDERKAKEAEEKKKAEEEARKKAEEEAKAKDQAAKEKDSKDTKSKDR